MHSERTICDRLNSKYAGNCKYKLPNAFIFGYGESDFFVQKDNGYAYEFEVKISRADFFKDSKKVDKHLILETGMFSKKSYLHSWCSENRSFKEEVKTSEQTHHFRPNKFYYVVPEGLIKPNEVPAYTGLMYVPEQQYKEIITVKEAPFIHKNKLDFEKVLCNKFYHYWLEMKRQVSELEYEIKYLKSLQKCQSSPS